MNIVFDSTLLQQDHLPLTLDDRAFCYGDGLFETVIYHRNCIQFWPDHYARLRAGMAALSMLPPEDFVAGRLEKHIRDLMDANQLEGPARIRIQVWRQPGGLYTPTSSGVHFLITARACPAPQVSTKAKVRFYEATRLHESAISAYKTCNGLPYVLAAIAKLRAAADDMILLDGDGHASECIASNLFWLKKDVFYTPSLQTGCVAGIMRKQLIQRMAAQGRQLNEGEFRKETVLEADCVFCCNVAGVQWLQQVENQRYSEDRWQEISDGLFYW